MRYQLSSFSSNGALMVQWSNGLMEASDWTLCKGRREIYMVVMNGRARRADFFTDITYFCCWSFLSTHYYYYL